MASQGEVTECSIGGGQQLQLLYEIFEPQPHPVSVHSPVSSASPAAASPAPLSPAPSSLTYSHSTGSVSTEPRSPAASRSPASHSPTKLHQQMPSPQKKGRGNSVLLLTTPKTPMCSRVSTPHNLSASPFQPTPSSPNVSVTVNVNPVIEVRVGGNERGKHYIHSRQPANLCTRYL